MTVSVTGSAFAARTSSISCGSIAGPGSASPRSADTTRFALPIPSRASACARLTWSTSRGSAPVVPASSRAPANCTDSPDSVWASTSCNSRANRVRSANAAACSRAARVAASWASNASYWFRRAFGLLRLALAFMRTHSSSASMLRLRVTSWRASCSSRARFCSSQPE